MPFYKVNKNYVFMRLKKLNQIQKYNDFLCICFLVINLNYSPKTKQTGEHNSIFLPVAVRLPDFSSLLKITISFEY